MVILLFLLGAFVLFNKEQVTAFFASTQAGQLGLVLNGPWRSSGLRSADRLFRVLLS
jgi:hypothetical protein